MRQAGAAAAPKTVSGDDERAGRATRARQRARRGRRAGRPRHGVPVARGGRALRDRRRPRAHGRRVARALAQPRAVHAAPVRGAARQAAAGVGQLLPDARADGRLPRAICRRVRAADRARHSGHRHHPQRRRLRRRDLERHRACARRRRRDRAVPVPARTPRGREARGVRRAVALERVHLPRRLSARPHRRRGAAAIRPRSSPSSSPTATPRARSR